MITFFMVVDASMQSIANFNFILFSFAKICTETVFFSNSFDTIGVALNFCSINLDNNNVDFKQYLDMN